MEHFNQSLFLLLNAGPKASSVVLAAAGFFAEDLVWLVPLGLIFGWLRGSAAARRVLLAATVAGLAALLINQLIGLAWYHPRPFEAGIGRTLIAHARDSSFPSDHLTLIWAIAFSLLMHEHSRMAGGTLALMGVPVAWARVYLGVHFPLDILGAALVALGSARFVLWQQHRVIAPLMQLLLPLHQTIFSGLIRRGWVAK